jgi:hypothetical protein
MVSTYEYYGKIFIYEETEKNNQLNDKNTVYYDKIYEIILDKDCCLTSQPTQLPTLHCSRKHNIAVRVSRTSHAVNVV